MGRKSTKLNIPLVEVAELEAGSSPISLDVTLVYAGTPSLRSALREWLATLQNLSAEDQLAYRGAIIAFAREVSRDIGGVKLTRQVTATDLADARSRLIAYLARDASRLPTVNRALQALRYFFSWCVDQDFSPLTRDIVQFCLEDAGQSTGSANQPGSANSADTMLNSPAVLALPPIPQDLSALDDAALRQLANQYIQTLKSTALYRKAQMLQEAVTGRVNAAQPRSRNASSTSANSSAPVTPNDKARATASLPASPRAEPRIEVH